MSDRIIKKVILDPGHGGADPGTSANGIVEKDYNLKISKYISKRLDELGIPNTLTRTTDETLSPSDRVKKIKSIYGTGNDVLLISNHLNSGGGDGAEIIYGLRNTDTFSKLIAKNIENEGQNVRKYYQRRLPSNPSKDYYFIIRDTANNESILMEYGFVDSTKDDVNQIKNDYEKLAEAMVKSIAEYMGVSYKEPLSSINGDYYIVQKGDTLWSIANKYKTTVNKLKSINNLSSNLIVIGQKLIIPSNTIEYIVQKGDTLYSISRKFNTTVTDIINKNNLKSTTIYVGQKLLIP
ncbi:MAG: LysM peptidoglycan-binding domain-containing protein [Bacilli bacterium]|nr:LysM peptidoglycan-binding domain-containing protein [Bacilli bacterium]